MTKMTTMIKAMTLSRRFGSNSTTGGKDKSAEVLRRLYRNLLQEGRRIDHQQQPSAATQTTTSAVKSIESIILARYPQISDLIDGLQRENDTDSLSSIQVLVRTVFRQRQKQPPSQQEQQQQFQQSIQDAMAVLRILISIDDLDKKTTYETSTRSISSARADSNDEDGNNDDDNGRMMACSTSSTSSTNTTTDNIVETMRMDWWLQQVEWLPNLASSDSNNDMHDDKSDKEETTTIIPVFPLSGPLLPSNVSNSVDDDDDCAATSSFSNTPLPLITYFSRAPVAGQGNVPLQIFEPRYRQMYRDLLSSSPSSTSNSNQSYSRSFVVPFAHPFERGVFSKYAWLYEIKEVEDVADQTSGRVALIVNHRVTRGIKMESIVNPAVWQTKDTYLQARVANVEGNNNKSNQGRSSDTVEPLKRALHKASIATNMNEIDKGGNRLAKDLLDILQDDGFWAFVDAWIYHQQSQLLHLQSRIADRIWRQAQQSMSTSSDDETDEKDEDDTKVFRKMVTDEMILLAQKPHRAKLESIFTEVSTLIPILLQKSDEEQVAWMRDRIENYFCSVDGSVDV